MVCLTRFEMRLSYFRLDHVCEAQGSQQSYETVRPAGPVITNLVYPSLVDPVSW